MTALDALLEDLRAAVGAEHVLVDADLRASYESDWTGRFTGTAGCVVRPADTDQVAAVVRACAAHGAAVVPQGGNTGLVGGAVPSGGEVVLSLRRLTALGEVDPVSGQVSAGAGVTLADLQRHVRAAGADFGVDLAARDSATVGGLAATNAGGIRVLRYGSMRAQVLGAEAVLADGSVVSRMGGLAKDGTGYDLVQLLVGSEGTLGVVTALRLRVVPQLRAGCVALLALESTDGGRRAAAGAARAAAAPGRRRAVLPRGPRAGPAAQRPARPVRPLGPRRTDGGPAYLLLECLDRTDPTDDLVEAVAEVARAARRPGRQRRRLAAGALGLPRGAHRGHQRRGRAGQARRVGAARGASRPGRASCPGVVAGVAPEALTVLFGHVNEGNLHVNVLRRRGPRRAGHRGGAVAGRGPGRQHQLRARRRPGQAALAAPVALGRGDRRHARRQARAGPGRPAQPGCAAALTGARATCERH